MEKQIIFWILEEKNEEQRFDEDLQMKNGDSYVWLTGNTICIDQNNVLPH